MTQTTAVVPVPVTVPNAIDPLPGQPVLHQPAAPATASGQPCPQVLVPSINPVGFPPAARSGPLRSGNPRGNPNLAPRCGAKARTTGCPCRAPAMPNGRCRMHGGKSTGPRTSAGLANLAKAHTTHGRYAQTGPDAEFEAKVRHGKVLARRVRLNAAAFDLLPWLPPAFSARLSADTATELQPPNCNAWFHAASVAPTAGPDARTRATATPHPPGHNPPGHNPRPRRDLHGRFAPPPPRLLRGRQAERARSRAEAAALAPWKLAIAEARIAMCQTPPKDRAAQRQRLKPNPSMPPAAHPGGGAPADATPPSSRYPAGDRPLAQSARIEFSRTNPMNRPAPPCPAGPADGSAKTPIHRGTVACPTGPTEPAGKVSTKTSIHPGTVPPSVISVSVASPADHRPLAPSTRIENPGTNPPARRTTSHPTAPAEHSAKTSIHPGTVHPAENPFRNALLASTVCNTPDAHRLAAKVERVGGWPILLAIDAAKQAGQDWRPAVVAVRQHLVNTTNRQRPPCIRLAAPIAQVVPCDATPPDP
jgi:hypothetical protein